MEVDPARAELNRRVARFLEAPSTPIAEAVAKRDTSTTATATTTTTNNNNDNYKIQGVNQNEIR